MDIAGKLIHTFPTETFQTKAGKDFTKKAIVIRIEGEYPQEIKVDVTGNAIDHVPDVGTQVTASIDIRGREYKRKDGERDWFTSLSCWKLSKAGTEQPQPVDDHVPF